MKFPNILEDSFGSNLEEIFQGLFYKNSLEMLKNFSNINDAEHEKENSDDKYNEVKNSGQ